MTPEQRELLQDKLGLWRQQADRGPVDFRDYNRCCAEALNAALARVTLLEGHVSTLEAQQRTDRKTIAAQAEMISRFKRYLADCEACNGTGKIEHEAVYTGPNPCSASVEACDACEGLGVEL